MRSARWPAPDLGEQLVGAVVVEVVVVLAPAADHAVRRGDDHVVHPLVARDPLGERGAGQPDPGPQLEDVDGAEHLAEDAGDAGRWGGSAPRRPGAAWSCRRRWGRGPPSARPPRRSSRRRRAAWPAPRRTVTSASSRTASMCCGSPSWVARAGAAAARGQPTYTAAYPASRGSSTPLPLSARFALWFSAWLARLDEPRRHARRDRRRRRGARRGRACPAPAGRPLADRRARPAAQPPRHRCAASPSRCRATSLGLAGPSDFNADVRRGRRGRGARRRRPRAWCPHRAGAACQWTCHHAVSPRQLPDPSEADQRAAPGAGAYRRTCSPTSTWPAGVPRSPTS